MDSSLWSRLEPLLDELLDLEPALRARRLARVQAEDPALHGALLKALDETAPLVGPSAATLARALQDDAVPARDGERVGPFVIRGELGRGGMGAVYLAERVEGGFDQQVAVKILKRGLDTEQVLERFMVERRILARLEHPHIARLVDGGMTADGLPWFAMERVDGAPITVHADRQRLDLAGRIRLLRDVCAAVAFAHEQRIVHRDIKPSNVLVNARGEVKLLDFGIAKLLDPGEARLTRTAAAVFTPDYAAPEQRAGGAITVATDVWQLGRLLAELASGPRARDLQRILDRALHEDPARRYATVAELAEDLRRHLAGQPVAAPGPTLADRVRRLARHRVALLGALLLAGGAAAWMLRTRDVSAPLRFELVSTFPGSHSAASFSPDAQSIAFLMSDAAGVPQVWTKRLDRGDPVQITRDPLGAHRPRWSPRGGSIVYDVPGHGIWSVPEAGGTPRQLVAEGYNPNLSPDGARLVYESGAWLWTANADGSAPRRVEAATRFTLEKEFAFIESTPAFSADGREVFYFQDKGSPVTGDLWSVDLESGVPRALSHDRTRTEDPVAMPDGSGVVYSSARHGGLTLWLMPAGGGEPRALTAGTGEDTEAAVSRDGRRLIYTNARNLIRLMWLDPRTGAKRQLLENRHVLTHPSFSPDGRRIAVFQGQGDDNRVWTIGLDGSDPRDMTGGGGSAVLPNFSPDGRWIHYYRLGERPAFERVPAGGGPPETVVPGWRFSVEHGAHVSPDGRRVVYSVLEKGVAQSTRVRELASGAEQSLGTPILWPRWSPDGSLVAGRARSLELTLCPASGTPCRGLGVDGSEPRWSREGRTIYFVRYSGYQGSRDPTVTPLWKIGVDGGAATHVADLEGPSPLHFFYDISPTGEIAWASFVPGRQELWMAELR